MKTIKQIADEIGVSKQAVHKKIKKEPLAATLQEFISTIDGAVYIEVDGERLIKSTFPKKEPSTETLSNSELPPTAEKLPSTVDGVVDSTANYINSLKEQISTLQEQLEKEKEYSREQISDLQNELTKEREHSRQQSDKLSDLSQQLAELTRNSQILLKQEQDKTTLLLPEQSPTVSSAPTTEENKAKRLFWQFWRK